MKLQSYREQQARWPDLGRHILAQFDTENLVVYQAYRPSIGEYAVRHQYFGGDFSFSRMSWIKPNFLWMMYRSGWGTKEGQEVTLAVTVSRTLFDEILEAAVPSSFVADLYATEAEWKAALASSDVRLQWDPDHTPEGSLCRRRAIQLGLRGEMLRRYARTEVVRIEDISGLVAREREHTGGGHDLLTTPEEHVYQPSDPRIASRIGLDAFCPT